MTDSCGEGPAFATVSAMRVVTRPVLTLVTAVALTSCAGGAAMRVASTDGGPDAGELRPGRDGGPDDDASDSMRLESASPCSTDAAITVEAGDAAPGGDAASIASLIQRTPTNLVSDGTSLFWVSSDGAGGPLLRMPVAGGAIATVVSGSIGGGFIDVDNVNVYFPGQSGGIARAPKDGSGSPSLVNGGSGAEVGAVTFLGPNAYWVEWPGGLRATQGVLKTARLKGGPVSTLSDFASSSPGPEIVGVTATTAFLSPGAGTGPLASFSLSSGVPGGGAPSPVASVPEGCSFLASDVKAVYCGSNKGTVVEIGDCGGTVTLGTLLEYGPVAGGPGALAFDDSYVYWVDAVTVGTIMRAPKGGGPSIVIARDTQPIAIAVDAKAVYWSDEGGHIMKLEK